MRTYSSRETIKARKVTDKDGEYVVTANGQRFARQGDYVVDRGGKDEPSAIDVMEKDAFETRYRAPSAPARKSASKSASGKRTGSQSTPSAAQRVASRGKGK